MEPQEGDIAEDGAGNFMVYRYGGWHRSDETGRTNGPIDASSQWGPGARELPNGTVERVGPRGGVTVVSTGGTGGEDDVGRLTEGQGKAVLYGGMMAGGERDYQRARDEGYNPASIRNQIADIAGIIPFDGDFFGRLIRDDVSDRGRQAELRWAEGNLRQLTGAAATNPEIARVAAINFDRGNDQLAAQRYQSRADTFRGTRFAAGSGAAALPDYPGFDGMAGPEDATGLPTYPGIQGGQEVSPIPAGAELRRGPDGKMYAVVNSQNLAPEDTPESLRAAGYQQDADGTWFRNVGSDLPPGMGGGSPPAGPSGPSGGGDNGGLIRGVADEGYQTALAQERATLEERGQRGIRRYDQPGFMGQMTGAFNDEAGWVAGYVPQALSNFGRTLTGQDIEVGAVDRARAVSDLTRQGGERFARENPGQNIAANLLGGALLGPGGAPTITGRMAQGAGLGGTYGFASAEGGVSDRLPAAGVGMVAGAVAAPVVERVVAPAANALIRPVAEGLQSLGRFGARQAGRAGNALNIPGSQRLIDENAVNPLASGMNRLADRSPQQVNALNSEAARYRAEQIDPTFADVVNDGGRGTMRALATRQTPARQTAREFADGRAAGLQDRVSSQARRTISSDPRQPAQIREEITTARNQRADQQFGAVRGEPVSPDRGIIDALRAPALRPAIEEAATAALNRGDSETANLLRQLTDGALDNPNGVQITVGMADRLARSLNGRAEAFQRAGNNDAAASYFALAERLRGGARQQVPGYDEALNSYAADSGLAQATELGEQFLSMEADQFAAAVARLTPEERQIAQAAARRAIERQAGTQGQAPGVAQRLSNGREQLARTEALTGDAAPVQRAMGAELQTLRNAQGINPSQGSPTSMNAQDAMGAAGMARDAVTGNLPGLAGRAMDAIRSRGFSDNEAQAIITAAVDPAQTDRLIAMLAERMTRREARNLARAIRYQLATNPPSSQQTRP
jgi:hypothetical protein